MCFLRFSKLPTSTLTGEARAKLVTKVRLSDEARRGKLPNGTKVKERRTGLTLDNLVGYLITR